MFPRQHEKIMPFLQFYEVLNKLVAENDERRLYGALAGYCKLSTGHAYISFLTMLTSSEIGLVNPEMTVESNYVIAIATLSDWLKSFSTNEKQTKPNRTMYA